MNAKNVTPEESAADDAPVVEKTVEETTSTTEVVDTPADSTEAAESRDAAATVDESKTTVESSESTTVSTATGEVTSAPVQTVYVTAPNPPRPKGNRGFGILMAVVATIVFAAVYAGVSALLIMFVSSDLVAGAVSSFIVNPLFYVPVVAFFVLMIIWALLANRAGWWSWVIGSLVIAVVTYFASIGVLLLMVGGFGLTASAATVAFIGFAVNPLLIAGALLARESAVWFGAVVATRGRKVRERNYAAWQEFENEEARKRAEFGANSAA